MTKPDWVTQLETKHGLPIQDIPGQVYVMHFDAPTVLQSVQGDYPHVLSASGGFESEPITHYVGWTQQADPLRRVRRHGAGAADAVVSLTPGTMRDEHLAKSCGRCPKCGASLSPANARRRPVSRGDAP